MRGCGRFARAARILALLLLLLRPQLAHAVPSFALQTGQPCTACHIGAFGPQLTPFGREFKIGGYTQGGGEGWTAHFPLAAMVQTSFTHTAGNQPFPAAPDFGDNNNFALDQISLFLAGRVTDYAGGFIQGTYSGIDRGFILDNTDLRLTTPLEVGDSPLRIGLSVNNNPTVQDPYNSTYAWVYPFFASSLAPTPAAAPLLAGGLATNSLGVTAYGWYDHSLYAEAGGYMTYGPTLLKLTGNAYGPGSTANIAPYARLAYEWNWNGQSAHVGALLLSANINPATAGRIATGAFGRDTYTDYSFDAGYQFLGDRTHIGTLELIFTHENQNLQASANAGTAAQPHHDLNQILAAATYYYQQTYGFTFGWQNTWGTADTVLYAPAPVTGSANGKPNSNAFILEADWVPFGKEDSWARPWANLKLGAQYTIYTQFNGGNSNYDGFGRRAADNNTLFLYAWMAF
jgi:hypothetical protein